MPLASSRALDVRPGDEQAVEQVEEWFLEYQRTHDRELRERIILAYLGLADRLALPDLLDGLSDLERRAVVLRFFNGLKQKQIGAELGYTQMHVSRVLHRALRRMREQLPP
jgi:RNA polymerase sigma factor (sigma-70 family)